MSSIVFFGNERLASGINTETPIIESLVEAGYKIDLVVVNQALTSGRNQRELKIAQTAKSHDIELFTATDDKELEAKLKEVKAPVGVLAAYGSIVPQSTIEVFPRGIINVHPSLLPEYRGPSPIEAAILNGNTTTGVSIMGLTKDMDKGPLYGFSEVKMTGSESKQDLYELLSELGGKLLVEILPSIFEGSATEVAQDDAAATYTQLISKSDGQIDWTKPADQIEREIRAFLGWPGSYGVVAEKDVIITSAATTDDTGKPGQHFTTEDKQLGVYCGQRALIISNLKVKGKAEMEGSAFVNGYLS